LPEKRQLVQVVENLDHPLTRGREIRALKDAAGTVKAQGALILSTANGDPFKIDNLPVEVRSIAEWLLED